MTACSRLAIVTASTNPARARACVDSWGDVPICFVLNGPIKSDTQAVEQAGDLVGHWIVSASYLGVVPAFRLGVDYVLQQWPGAEIIACLHDDVELRYPLWAQKVLRHFDRQPACGLAGFGGAIGLGSDDLYQAPYDPMQLARRGFRSNMTNAEAHGVRSLLSERVACLDGFSQIGRRAFWEGWQHLGNGDTTGRADHQDRPWTYLESLGVIHHAYDAMLGALAARYGWETWYLPVACQHYGGRTAVGDPGYAEWARAQTEEGDQGFWRAAHEICYREFKDVLPIRI